MAQSNGKKKPRREYTVSSKALAQRRHNSALMPAETEEERNYNARYIDHIMKVHEISRHAIKGDLTSLKSCFVAYVQLCQADGFKISNLSAYAAMGLTQTQFNTLKKKDDPEAKELVNMVLSICSLSRETLIADSKLNPVIGIFWQRNYDGLRNDTEQVQNANETDEGYETDRSYEERYMDLI